MRWTHQQTGEQKKRTYFLPLAIGRSAKALPKTREGETVSSLVLDGEGVADFHAMILMRDQRPVVAAPKSVGEVLVNGKPHKSVWVANGDRLSLGPYQIILGMSLLTEKDSAPPPPLPVGGGPTDGPPAGNPPPIGDQPPPPPPPAGDVAGQDTGEGCQRWVGVLFPRVCGRLSSVGCPHCDADHIGRADEPRDNDPFFLATEHNMYPDFGDYTAGHWGEQEYGGKIRAMDFTDADAQAFGLPGNDFEQDMGAS